MLPKAFLLLLLCLAIGVQNTASITIERDGGYRNLVIKIDNSVPEDYCHIYIKNLKTLLTEASNVLNTALDGRVYLAQVTLVIPTFWRDPRCHQPVHLPQPGVIYQDADIMIMPESPIYGSSPHTQQSKGCGQPGDKLIIPQSFLTEWNTTNRIWPEPGKLFVKEWAKLRYGVFDEQGYPNDSIYQNFYKVQDKVLHSGNTDAPVLGVWMHPDGSLGCDPKTGACQFQVEGPNQEVTCSLGYMPQLPNVKRWCDKVGLPFAPTKHNVLCSGKSALQVINSHPDFQVIQPSSSLPTDLSPRIDIVRQPLPRYVLLIETSSSLSPVWKWVRKAVQNLIRYVVPDNSNVAVVTFNTKAKVEHGMVQLTTEDARSRMADSIPDSPNKLDHNSEKGCVPCGIQTAIENVLGSEGAGGHIIIIANEEISTQSLQKQEEIMSNARNSGVRISSVVVTSPSSVNSPANRLNSPQPGTFFFEALGKSTGGVSTAISADMYTLQMYTHFIQSLSQIISTDTKDPLNHAITIHKEFYLRQDAKPITGSFLIDSTLGRHTEFGIYVEDSEEHEIKSVTFTDNESVEYGPFTKMSSSHNVVNFKTINFNVKENHPPFDSKRGTRWEYKIEWYEGSRINSTKENVVTVRSKPNAFNENDLIKVKTWTNFEDGQDITPDNLLAIFVQVEKGQRPVANARVKIYLSVEVGDGTIVLQDKEIMLIDDGYGEPDITRGDGIYSKFITEYPSSGKYTYQVVVDNQSGAASTVSAGQAITGGHQRPYGPQPCCGSFVPVPAERTERLGVFQRKITGPSIYIQSVRLGSGDKIRPGKIGDLKVTNLADSQQLLATWTAPGGDFNDGNVMTYRFVFSQKIEELLTPSTNAPALDGLKETFSPGTIVKKEINFKYYNAYYYIGLFASDEAGNRGRMSNIVLVRVPAPPTTTDVTSTEPIILEKTNDWTLVGAIIGALVVVLLVILIGLYCRFFRRNQRFSKIRFASHLKSNGVRIPSTTDGDSRKESTSTDSYEAEKTNNISNNLPHPKVSNTSFANNLTPTYWSASQLLAEHEIRKHQEQLEQIQAQQQQHQNMRHSGHHNGHANHDLSRTNEGLWVEPEDYMTRIPGGYADYSGHPSGGNEFDYPDVVNYHPGNNYSVQDVHMAGDRNRHYSTNGPPGFSYRPEYAIHNDYSDYGGIHSDYDTGPIHNDYGMTAVGELPPGVVAAPGDSAGSGIRDYDSVLNKSSQRLMNSDVSSSTLGMANPSLLGSQLSLYSGVPGGSRNSQAKNRNITQV